MHKEALADLMFNIFINVLDIGIDHESALFKYADDFNILDESENAVARFLSWSENNNRHSNPKKCN